MKPTRHTSQISHKFLVHKLNNQCISVTQIKDSIYYSLLIRCSYKESEMFTRVSRAR